MSNALVSAVRSIVTRVKSIAESRILYEEGLGLTCTGEEEITAAQVEGLWGLNSGIARVAQFAQAGEPCGMVELVEWSEGLDEHIRDPHSPRDYGWLTNNQITSNMQRGLEKLSRYGARAISEPKEYMATRRITETMIDTATGERLTLIQAGEPTAGPPFGLAVGTFGASVPDYDASIKFYRDALGLTVAFAMNHTGAPFDALLGAPEGTRLRMALMTSDGNWTGKYEALELNVPAGNAAANDANPRAADGLRNGSWMASAYAKADLELIAEMVVVGGGTVLRGPVELNRPCVGLARAMVARAPGGELLEILSESS